MSYMYRLKSMLHKAQQICDEAETRFATIDWTHEFDEIDNDDKYSPVPFLNDDSFYEALDCPETKMKAEDFYSVYFSKDAKEFMKSMTMNAVSPSIPDDEKQMIKDILNQIQTRKAEIIKLYLSAIRTEYFKIDFDFRPSIYCPKCDIFFTNAEKQYEHECKKTTKCKFCGLQEKTFERLEHHIEVKHLRQFKHECKECDFRTESDKEWERHNNSKAHKDKVGIVRETYECKVCDKQYYFKSKYEEHLLSVKHRKLCCK